MERANAYDAQLLSFMGVTTIDCCAAGSLTLIEYPIHSNETSSIRSLVKKRDLRTSVNNYSEKVCARKGS